MQTNHSSLYTKYPNIFIPHLTDNCVCFPDEWLNVVDHMCSTINTYSSKTNVVVISPRLKYRYMFYVKYWPKLKAFVFKILDPERNYYFMCKKVWVNPAFDNHRINNTLCYKLLNSFNKLAFKFFNGYSFFENQPKFKINEITNTEGNLVLYYSGADNFIRGVISLAQHIIKSKTVIK